MPSITIILALVALGCAILSFIMDKKIELVAVGVLLLALAILIPA